MFERSEFGHRTLSGEKRRVPMRPYRIGKRQEQWSLVTFCRNRKSLGQRPKAFDLARQKPESLDYRLRGNDGHVIHPQLQPTQAWPYLLT